jgi:hypothetical protein
MLAWLSMACTQLLRLIHAHDTEAWVEKEARLASKGGPISKSQWGKLLGKHQVASLPLCLFFGDICVP